MIWKYITGLDLKVSENAGADAEAHCGSHWNVCIDSKGCINDAIFKTLVGFLLSM